MAQWAMDANDTGPVEVELLDAKFLPAGSLFNAATETKYRCRYANGVELVCQTDKSLVGARFEGSEGMVQTGYGGFFTRPESLKTSAIGPQEVHLYASSDHVRNFLDCVKSRREPAAPVEVGHRSATVCHLGVIAVAWARRRCSNGTRRRNGSPTTPRPTPCSLAPCAARGSCKRLRAGVEGNSSLFALYHRRHYP